MTPTEHRGKPEFEALYDRTADRLLVSLTRRTQDPEVAGELWAECWAAAFEEWPKCRASEPEQEEAWLFGIARRRLADYWRTGATERRALERLHWTVPAASHAEDEELVRIAELDALRDVLAEALAALPKARRSRGGAPDRRRSVLPRHRYTARLLRRRRTRPGLTWSARAAAPHRPHDSHPDPRSPSMTNRIEEMRAQIHATPMAPAPAPRGGGVDVDSASCRVVSSDSPSLRPP